MGQLRSIEHRYAQMLSDAMIASQCQVQAMMRTLDVKVKECQQKLAAD